MCRGCVPKAAFVLVLSFLASTAILGSLLDAGTAGSAYPGFDEVGGVC